MSSQLTPNLDINYKWMLGEDNWNVGMDENLLKLDSLIQLSVISKDLNSPPPLEANFGDRYIVNSSPLYEWENNQNNIAIYQNSIWNFIIPKPGFIAYIKDINKLYIYNTNNIWEEVQTSNIQLPDLTANNISFTPTDNILSINTQDAIEEVNTKIITSNSISYPLWKINENETINVLERQEYGINSGVLYLIGSIYLNIESTLVVHN